MRGRLLEHGGEPGDPLVPPVAEQLGVERAAEQAAAARIEARGGALHEVAGVLAGERERRRVVVRVTGVAPWLQVVDRPAVVVPVGPARRIAVALVPHQLDRSPVDRHRHRPGLGGDWA